MLSHYDLQLLFEMFLKMLHIEQNTRQYFLVLFNMISFLTAELQLSDMHHEGTQEVPVQFHALHDSQYSRSLSGHLSLTEIDPNTIE